MAKGWKVLFHRQREPFTLSDKQLSSRTSWSHRVWTMCPCLRKSEEHRGTIQTGHILWGTRSFSGFACKKNDPIFCSHKLWILLFCESVRHDCARKPCFICERIFQAVANWFVLKTNLKSQSWDVKATLHSFSTLKYFQNHFYNSLTCHWRNIPCCLLSRPLDATKSYPSGYFKIRSYNGFLGK